MKHEKPPKGSMAPESRKNPRARSVREELRGEDKRLGRFMASVRTAAGMSQRTLAKRLSVPHSWVSKNEVAQRGVNVEDFIKWARGVNANAAELLGQFAAEHPTAQPREGATPGSDAQGSC